MMNLIFPGTLVNPTKIIIWQRRHFGKSQVIHVITEYSDKWWKLWIIYFILDTKISEESVYKQVYSSTCSTKELSISMTKIVHAVKGGLLSYCDKVYSRVNINQKHCIGGVMVSVLTSSAVDRGFEPRSGQTKDYKIDSCCFSAKHAALRRKSNEWLAQNQNNCPNGVTFLPAYCCFSELAL
jgi:hypothetical protein